MTDHTIVTEISITTFNYLREHDPDSFQLIDVRNPDEYAQGNLDGLLIPLSELPRQSYKINPEKEIIVHCQHGVRSAKAVEWLQEKGFKNVLSLAGGYAAWLEKTPT